MKLRLVSITAIVLLMAAPLPASAERAFYSGKALQAPCAAFVAKKTNFDSGVCFGYIAGIADAMDCENAVFGWRYSRPNVKLGPTVKAVLKWFREHPEKLHLDAGGLVAQALAETWPCPTQ